MLFSCGLQAQLILMYSVWLFFTGMWAHVYCLDERESWWFFEILVIILPLLCVFFYVTCSTREHQKFLSTARVSHIPSTYPLPALPLFASVKVSPTALSFSISHFPPLILTHSFLLSFLKSMTLCTFHWLCCNSITLRMSFSASCSCG